MGEIDGLEARYYFSTLEQKEFMRHNGYVDGLEVASPAVVSLNGTIASLAANEFAMWVSGARAAHPHTELDLIGSGRPIQSQWVAPRRVRKDLSCVICNLSGTGDEAQIEHRYVVATELRHKTVRYGGAGRTYTCRKLRDYGRRQCDDADSGR
jgi:hypothetical protein